MRKVVIAGSRDFDNYNELKRIIDSLNLSPEDEIVSGTAKGSDSLGELYGENNNIKVVRYPAEWDKYGKVAGFKRNAQMADYATEGVIFWDGRSRGSQNMIYQLGKMNKPFRIALFTTVDGAKIVTKVTNYNTKGGYSK